MRKIQELGQQGVQFATFPETDYPFFSIVQSGYQILRGGEFLKLLDQSVTVPSLATEAIGEACRQAGVVVSIGVNERDGGTIYNTQLLFDSDGTLIQRRRKITPTHYERMIWGQGDGSGPRAVDSKVARIGQLACFEHYNPLARYAMMADGEQIHSAMFPGPMFGDGFARVRRSRSGSMRWSPGALSFVLRRGWMLTSRLKLPRTRASPTSDRSPAVASPRSSHLMRPYWVNLSDQAKVKSPSTSISR